MPKLTLAIERRKLQLKAKVLNARAQGAAARETAKMARLELKSMAPRKAAANTSLNIRGIR